MSSKETQSQAVYYVYPGNTLERMAVGRVRVSSMKVKRKTSASPKKCSVNTAAEHKLCRSPLSPSFTLFLSLYAPSLLHHAKSQAVNTEHCAGE